MPQEKLQTLFDNVSKHADIGTYEDFHSAMSDSNRRRKFFDSTSKVVDLGDFSTFETKVLPNIKGGSPTQVKPTSNPPSPAEDSVGDVWERGIANIYKGAADVYRLLDGWATDLSKTTGLSKGNLFESAENWLLQKAEKRLTSAAPPTGKYSKPPENLLGYLDAKRMYKVAGENIPLMGAFIATTIANPVAGASLMFGVEGGSARRSLDQYEKETGNVVDPFTRTVIPMTVGVVNAALERVGIGQILKTAKAPGLKSKLFNIALSSITEGTTEGAQEIVQALGEAGYRGDLPNDVGERFIESVYAGLVLGFTGGAVTGTFGHVGESERNPLVEKIRELNIPEVEIRKKGEKLISEDKDFPEFKTTEQALTYGTLNIKDEDVPKWKTEIESINNTIQEFRTQGEIQKAADLIFKNQFLKEALGAKLNAHIEYTPEKGFIEHKLTDSGYEGIIRSISGSKA